MSGRGPRELVLGLGLGYDGGIPTGGVPDGWEGAMAFFLRLGVVFDLSDDQRWMGRGRRQYVK